MVFSLFSLPGGGLIHFSTFREGAIDEGGGVIYSSKKPAMEIISLNWNKLKIITQYISYNNNIYGWRGVLERGLISFFHSREGVI